MTGSAATVAGGTATAAGGAAPEAGRWELLRALGAFALGHPAETAGLAASLGLPLWTPAAHTRLFVLSLPPYASIYLGAEGMLGGEAADRVAGVWRALGLAPPGDADHLGVILALYAEAGEAARAARSPATRQRLDHVRAAVLWEHLWPWVPGYLDAVRRESRAAAPWADLASRALAREARLSEPPGALPLALRSAPAGLTAGGGYGDLPGALTTPVRTGFILTRGDLGSAGRQLGLGLRLGERRFALRALLEQDSAATLAWLSGHARRSARHHRRQADMAGAPGRLAGQWWAARASRSAAALVSLAENARQAGAGTPLGR